MVLSSVGQSSQEVEPPFWSLCTIKCLCSRRAHNYIGRQKIKVINRSGIERGYASEAYATRRAKSGASAKPRHRIVNVKVATYHLPSLFSEHIPLPTETRATIEPWISQS